MDLTAEVLDERGDLVLLGLGPLQDGPADIGAEGVEPAVDLQVQLEPARLVLDAHDRLLERRHRFSSSSASDHSGR